MNSEKSTPNRSPHVVIVGGGAAGMMAALSAAENGAAVTILEQNEKLGKKLYITGKGRCNLTNEADPAGHLDNIVSNARFMFSAETLFDAKAVCALFNGLGTRLKVERGGRVFPESDHASDITRALEYECRRLGVKISLDTKVAGLDTEEITEAKSLSGNDALQSTDDTDGKRHKTGRKKKSGYSKKCVGVILDDGTKISADAVILATGGVSYPSTGADGSGLEMARRAGHKVTDLYPALVPLLTKEKWVADLAGLTLKNIAITVKNGNKKVYEDFGELLFTHTGVSGPVILSASSHITGYLKEDRKKDDAGLLLCIDLKPALDREKLDKRLIRDLEEAAAKQMKNILGQLMPKSMIPVVLDIAGIDEDKRACDLTRAERVSLLDTLKCLPLTITGTFGFDAAVITRGGISVKEIDPHTMGSKLIKNLYFAGECMDVDALTGGYNLQIAWSSGHAAGAGAAKA
ncbi:MAG: NAD(P)/FAD-dependent oxidoreductase [Lachnospiraceae bacterium]|nr:NAD(P)/FAD-dependent oxidoreductase [Lachnospiraceae bacterium]